jgi:two-component system CheB/CheR fusion protein
MKKNPSSKPAPNKDPLAHPTSKKDFLVVGLGASAGGIKALKDFFANVPKNSGNAYVVILHLSPEHESHLAEVLQTNAAIPVTQVKDKQVKVKPNSIYVISPNKSLVMNDGHLSTTEIETHEERRAPVDIFFRTLAESRETYAVSVILSGTGPDGSMGVKRVKEKGGIIIVQDPSEAEYDDMPRNSIATGLVDYVLPVADIPAQIKAYKKQLGSLRIPLETEDTPDEANEKALREIFTQLRVRTGHDFSNYKRATVLRRIERRMNVHALTHLPDYSHFMRSRDEETHALLKDLLISVTNFFRDDEPFKMIEREIIPKILANKTREDAARIWVAGCATGEEAYSLAMLFAEQTADRLNAPKVQVFATDIDENAIAMARAGLYTNSDVADVSPERLKNFFVKEGDNYRVKREIREMVLFAAHNVTKDPPFSNLDLVTCRNLLIYLNRIAQNRVMETAHFALKAGGYLFLGSSESAEGAGELFITFSKENRIFQSRPVAARLSLPVPNLALPLQRQKLRNASENYRVEELRALERLSYTALHQQLLEQYAPPSVVVNEDFDIVHISERAGRYMQFSGGEPSTNLLQIARPELRLELRTALYKATKQKTDVVVKGVEVSVDSRAESVNIIIRPALREDDVKRGYILVIFEPSSPQDAQVYERVLLNTSDEPIARELEEELVRTKAQLRVTVEQYEVQTEELKASNEELQAINEELRSAAEELETSKEELQSINEELQTVNQELKIKIEELSQSHNDLQNLMNSTDIGTIFVDREMRVKMFTEPVKKVFNLIKGDLKRPLSDITNRLAYDGFKDDIDEVFKNLQTVEREIQTGDHWYLMRVFPYRTSEHQISGAVITFLDITERKISSEILRAGEEKVRLLIESSTDYAIFTVNEENLVDSWNVGAERTFGYTEAEIIGKSGAILFTKEDRERGVPAMEIECAIATGKAEDERWHVRKDGSRFYASGVMQPLRDNKGFVKICRDQTDKLKSEAAVKDKDMLKQLVSTQEDERRRIARDIHDHFGQQMTALRLKLESVKEMCNEKKVCDEIDEVDKIAIRLDREIDFIAWELRPAALDDLGLRVTLGNFVKEWSRHTDIPADFHTTGLGKTPLDFEIETNLYRIAQEALNNVFKHAEAKNVSVLLEKRKNEIALIIEDDGKGFNPADKANRTKGIGLVGMNERAKICGGSLVIESKKGKGTTVFARVPAKIDKK